MARDSQHQKLHFKANTFQHHYGPRVHLLSSPLTLGLLAKLGKPETKQPEINHLVRELYNYLFDNVAGLFFPVGNLSAQTRMSAFHPEGIYEGEAISLDTQVVTVDLARAGTLPSQICYEKLNLFLNPDQVRQDHFYIARTTNADGKVTGVNVSGSKIGGPVEGRIVLFPDPMGATGGTIVEVYNRYLSKEMGTPAKMIAMHLMVTPEYLRRVTAECPQLEVVALRLDRGLSSEQVLGSIPGSLWDQEKGLNEHQYIVPGAGGLGEILNNAYC